MGTRSLASRIVHRIPAYRGGDRMRVLRARTHALKLVKSFGHTVKYSVTEDGCNPHIEISKDTSQADINAMTTAALRAELETFWDVADVEEAALVEKILTLDCNRPLVVLNELVRINSTIFSDPLRGGLDPVNSAEIDRSITVLHHILGRCERILRTPIYTPYTKF